MSGIKVTVTNENSGFSKVLISPLPLWLGESVFSPDWDIIQNKPSTFPPDSHTHPISEVTNLQSELNSKAGSAHTHPASDITDFAERVVEVSPPADWNTLEGKPSTFPPDSHTHPISEVTNLQSELDSKAEFEHTHTASDITDFAEKVTEVSPPAEWDTLQNKPSSFPPDSHTHTPSEVGLGNVSNAAQVTSVTGTAPIVSSGGTTPAISISAATTTAAGSMSASDKTKLDGIAAGAEVNVNADWNATTGDAEILNKPATFPPSEHTHTIDDIDTLWQRLDGIGMALDGNSMALEGKADLQHTHEIEDVTNLQDVLNMKADSVPVEDLFAALEEKADIEHTHPDATQSEAGFLSTADKTKLDGIAAGAEVNVNADWNATSGDAQILNKPTLGTAAAANTTDFAPANFVGSPVEYVIAASNETTALTAGAAKVTFRAPVAFRLLSVAASVTVAPTGSTLIVDINNEANSVLFTKLSIDATEKSSATAATAAVLISPASFRDFTQDAEITIDIDQVGSTVAGAGLKVILRGTRL